MKLRGRMLPDNIEELSEDKTIYKDYASYAVHRVNNNNDGEQNVASKTAIFNPNGPGRNYSIITSNIVGMGGLSKVLLDCFHMLGLEQ